MKNSSLRDRGGSRFEHLRDPKFVKWAKETYGCVLRRELPGHECWGRLEFAHVFKTRANAAPDKGEGVPLCQRAHREQEGRTFAFMMETEVNVQLLAREIAVAYDALHGEGLDGIETATKYMTQKLDEIETKVAQQKSPLQQRALESPYFEEKGDAA